MGLKEKFLRNGGRHSQEGKTDVFADKNEKSFDDELVNEEVTSRAQQRKNLKTELADEKKRKLSVRLNWMIVCLIVAIICVYLFMVYVNF